MGARGTKKRRRGGRGDGGTSTAAQYPALVPEDEWEYIVTEIAEAFGQDWWDVYHCKPHGQPHLTWYCYYRLDEKHRIDELRRELDAVDSAILTASAVNDPSGLDVRRRELRARLRDDPSTPAKREWTRDEMQAVAQRLVAAALTGKPVS